MSLFVTHKTGSYPIISRALEDLVSDEHDLDAFGYQERATFVYGLQLLLEAMFNIGEAEHTNDWDWCLAVEDQEGKMHGDYQLLGLDEDAEDKLMDEQHYCDMFHVTYKGKKIKTANDFPHTVDMDTYREMEIVLELPEPETVRVEDAVKLIISRR